MGVRLTRRGRVALGATGIVLALTAAAIVVTTRGHPIVIPADPCASPPPLQTYAGVMLQPKAMVAFKAAQRIAKGRIEVVQSYRSCAEQAAACRRICGNAGGCPDLCASPGKSYHQLGAAIDISSDSLKATGVIRALETAGWCEPLPTSDPGHFSFGGCH